MSDDEDDRESLAPVQPGDVMLGKYRVDRVLGAGGMGVVVAATHMELDEKVAIKFLHPDVLDNEEALQRFLREARAAVKIKSEHVARVIDVGRLDTGAPYMVLEYLEGKDLSAALKSEEPPSLEDAVDYVIQACDAMAEAHAAGIVHRDLKPANLFRIERSDGSKVVKVLDFGISKVAMPDMADAGLTRTSTAMGSPLYMSPEQMRSSKDVDLRTDIWSLGIILFELLCKKTPFTGSTFPELCASVLGAPPLKLQEQRPDAPEALEAVIHKCLRKEPWERYKSVAELAKALEPFAPGRSRPTIERIGKILERAGMPSFHDMDVTVTVASQTGTDVDVVARTAQAWTETKDGVGKASEKPKSNRALILALAGVLGVGVVAVGYAFSRSGDAVEPSGAASTASALATTTTQSAAVAPVPPPDILPAESAAPSASAEPPAPVAAPKVTTKPTSKPSTAPASKPNPAPAPAPSPTPTPAPAPAPTPKNPLDMGLK
ncbi:MAG: serine/threonine-protein kinase [Polyangiaceae bacterium]